MAGRPLLLFGVGTVDYLAIYRAWWADVGTRLAPSSSTQYRRNVLRALADMGRDPTTVPAREIQSYLDSLRVQYARVTHAALSDFFDFLVLRGFRAANPLKKMEVRTRGGRRVRRGLSEEELARLLVAAVYAGYGRQRWGGTRLAWAILAQYALGLRPGELVSLTTDEIDLNRDPPCVLITHTKTGNDRAVPVGAIAREALEELMEGRTGCILGIGRTQYWAHVRRAARLAGLPDEKCRPYSLRHTFASHLVEKGVHIRVIAELLGHSDLRATTVYTTPSDHLLRSAVQLLGT